MVAFLRAVDLKIKCDTHGEIHQPRGNTATGFLQERQPFIVTCIDLKSFFKAKIDCTDPKNFCFEFSKSNVVMCVYFFAVITVNSCKCYSSSFSHVQCMCTVGTCDFRNHKHSQTMQACRSSRQRHQQSHLSQHTEPSSFRTTSMCQVFCCFANSVNILSIGNVQRPLMV